MMPTDERSSVTNDKSGIIRDLSLLSSERYSKPFSGRNVYTILVVILAVLVLLSKTLVGSGLNNASALYMLWGARSALPIARGEYLQSGIVSAKLAGRVDSSAQPYVILGRACWFEGNSVCAGEALERAVGIDNANLLAKIFLAMAYNAGGRSQQAMALWAQMDGANYFRVRKDYETAVVVFKLQIADGKANISDYVGLGEAYEALMRWQDACDTYESEIRRFPETVDGYDRLARVEFWRLDNLERALWATQQAILLTPPGERYHLYLNMGDMNWVKQRGTDAITWYEQAVNINSARKEAHIGLGRVYLDRGQAEEAIAELRKAQSIDPRDSYISSLLDGAVGHSH